MIVFAQLILPACLISFVSMTRSSDYTTMTGSSDYTTMTTTSSPTDEPPSCPDGWVNANYLGCFYFDNSKPDRHLSWVEAVDAGDDLGGYLAEIQTEEQADLIASIAMLENDLAGIDSWWVGLSDIGHEGRWIWSHSDVDSTYLDWVPGNPNLDPHNRDDCVQISKSDNYLWRDVPCYEKVSASPICQKDIDITTTTPVPTTTPFPGCPSGWSRYENSCFIYITSSDNYCSYAQSHCESLGGNLASLHNQEEFNFVQNLISYSDRIWIGGSDVVHEGTWTWSDGSDWDYENWLSDQPDDTPDQNCAVIDGAGWRDLGCTESYYS